MRILQVFILILIISGCVKHQSSDGLDIESIESSALNLLDSYPADSIVKLDELPLPLSCLKPYSVRIDEFGVYIKLDEVFVSESGLFISHSGHTPDISEGLDPSFKLLKNRTYSYLIKG